jgi:hypothetical protein
VIGTDVETGLYSWSEVSMLHQFRCLIMIRRTMIVMAGLWKGSQALIGNQSDSSIYREVGFCSDYFREVWRRYLFKVTILLPP